MEQPQEDEGFSIYFLFVDFFDYFLCGSFFVRLEKKNMYCQKEMTLEWNLQKFSRDFSQHLSPDSILTSGIYFSPFFQQDNFKSCWETGIIECPTSVCQLTLSSWPEGRKKRPGPFFSGTVQTCAVARWHNAAREVFGTFRGCATFFMQNKQSEIFHQGILQAHYPTRSQTVCIP